MRSRILLGAVVAVGLVYVGCGEKAGGNAGDGTLAAPANLTASPMGGGVHLVWADTASEESFEIERSSSTNSFAKIASVTFDTTQHHDQAGLTGGETYTYRVRAAGGGTFSPYSNSVTAVAPGGSGGGAGGGTGGGSGGGTGFDGLADGGYSFQTHIVPIFVQSCGSGNNSCHSKIAYGPTAAGECRGWLALSDEALGSKNPTNNADTGCPDLTLHQRLMQLDAWMCDNPRRKYVVPGDVAGSQLYQVVDLNADPSRGGQCVISPTVPMTRMPKAPYVISSADINKLKVWIQQGAPNN